jgi:tetratricopeptide (TPR) repeat protein
LRRPALLLVAALLALGGCSRAERRSPCQESDTARPVDQPLLAFLCRARAAHHLADQAEAARDLPGAVRALIVVVDGPLPHEEPNAPEVREVLADTLARIADYESQLGDFDAAAGHVARGLERIPPTPTYFRGHLYEVKGLVEERRADALRARGDNAAAEQAKTKALDALETAMKIQAEVIEASAPGAH